VEDDRSQALINPADDLHIDAQITGQPIGRNLLIETLDDCDLAPQLGDTLLLLAVPALDVASPRPVDLERSAENTLLAPQKVGRAPKYCFLSISHMLFLLAHGYETP